MSFLRRLQSYWKNEHFDFLSCESCLQDIANEWLDFAEAGDHPVSFKIHQKLFLTVEWSVLFDEYK